MTYRKFETKLWCFGGSHYSSTTAKEDDVTSKGTKLLVGNCVGCKGKNQSHPMKTVLGQKFLSIFFRNMGKTSVRATAKDNTILY